MKRLFVILLFLMGSCAILTSDKKLALFPSFDLSVPAPHPKSAHLLQGPIERGKSEGLEYLRAAVGGQPTRMSLFLLMQKFPVQNVTVVDLREESHAFVNGLPFSWKYPYTTWTNRGKTLQEIEADEEGRLQLLRKQPTLVLDPHTQPLPIAIGQMETEKALVESMGLRYVRIPITENHPPKDSQVDEIVQLLLNLPQGEWIYAHCHGGRGRATLFAAIYDILLNHDKLSLREILERQHHLGGTDLQHVPLPPDNRHVPISERVAFLQRFYLYCNAGGPGHFLFSEWRS